MRISSHYKVGDEVDKFISNNKEEAMAPRKKKAAPVKKEVESTSKEPDSEITKVFDLFDLDKTGMITMDNLREIAKELNEDITEDELQEMVAEADMDGDSQINKEEFQEIMKKTNLY